MSHDVGIFLAHRRHEPDNDSDPGMLTAAALRPQRRSTPLVYALPILRAAVRAKGG